MQESSRVLWPTPLSPRYTTGLGLWYLLTSSSDSCIVPDLLPPFYYFISHPSISSTFNLIQQTFPNNQQPLQSYEYSFVRYPIHQQRASSRWIQELPSSIQSIIMSTDAAPTPLSKVDSAVQGLSSSPPKNEAAPSKHRRASSTAAPGVFNVNDLGMPAPLFFHPPDQPVSPHLPSSTH